MKILVTGGAGFIGSHTVDLLVDKGYDVKNFDKLELQVHGNKKPDYINQNAEFVFGDVTKIEDWLKVLKGIESVIHLAAMVGVGQSMYQPVRYLLTNTIGTANMYEVILNNEEIRKNIKKIVVASSKSIYGEGAYECEIHGTVYPEPRPIEQLQKKEWEVRCPLCKNFVKPIGITEEKPTQNLSTYALSKYDTEKIAINFGLTLKIPTIVLRYFNVYGPRQSLNNPYTGVAAIFMSRIKNKNSPIIFEDGKQSRDFIFVEDIANANVLAIENGIGVNVYNVGTGNQITIKAVAETLIDLIGSDVSLDITEKFRVGDNRHDFADITKIKKDLNFKPKWDLKSGFRKFVEWAETEKAIDKFEESERERMKYLG